MIEEINGFFIVKKGDDVSEFIRFKFSYEDALDDVAEFKAECPLMEYEIKEGILEETYDNKGELLSQLATNG